MRTDNLWRLGVVSAVALISLYLIYPTFYYFMAVSGKVSVTPEKLDQLRKESVPLGLDLQGGVDVLLAVDEAKTRQNKIDGYADDIRLKFKNESPSIDATIETTTGTGDAQILVTLNKPAEQGRSANNILNKYKSDEVFKDYADGSVSSGKPVALTINPLVLSQDIVKTVDSSLKVIRERVDKLGVTQPVVVKQGNDRIRVQIPGEKDPEEVVKTVIKPAHLEFRGVHTGSTKGADDNYPEDSDEFIDGKTGKAKPGKQIPSGYEAILYKQMETDSSGVSKTNERYMLVKRKTEMDGSKVQDSWVAYNPASLGSAIQVYLQFRPDGAKLFGDITDRYLHKPLAILLDGVVYSAPNIKTQITEGTCYIESNNFTQEEAKNLSLVLKAGALPAELVTKEKRTVEATLGADSIRTSVFALVVGSIIVAAYMMIYYGTAGFLAVAAIIIHSMIIFAFMKMANATLTLSGIGGILLTVGMAVDANVLIYERIREELAHGKSLKAAIPLGFNRSFAVIFDANLATLISALTLLQFGEGSVKGFALSLNIGIIATLFTGLYCTHTLVDLWFEWKNSLGLGSLKWFRPDTYIDFIGLRKYSYVWSGLLFFGCILWVLPFKPFPGSNWGIDFEGGLLSDVQTSASLTSQQVQGHYQDWKVQKISSGVNDTNSYIIRTKLGEGEHIANTQEEVKKRLELTVGKDQFRVLGSEAVGTEVGQEFTHKAILACLVASIGILIYMWFRFEFLYGLSAVIALFHDLIITYGIFNILSHYGYAGEVTLDVVAALLVILGYSVNDTIIIFDRARENIKLHPGMPFRKLINSSICESLNRTVMTVSTVLIVLLVMLFVGGAGLHDFALVLLIGIIKGTYSSSFIAAPILHDLHEREQNQKGDAKRKSAAAPAARSMAR